MKPKDSMGRVTARPCPHCGHHEVGYTTAEGEFHALKPGTLIQVLGEPGLSEETPIPEPEKAPTAIGETPEVSVPYRAWIPEPFRAYRDLRLIYGVWLLEEQNGRMTPLRYRSAYLEKLERLIEKEIFTPLPVLLDRFFDYPHLAAGRPNEIAMNMFNELDEIRAPAQRMERWLEQGDEESLEGMIQPFSKEERLEERVDDEALMQELQELTLEGYLELLVPDPEA